MVYSGIGANAAAAKAIERHLTGANGGNRGKDPSLCSLCLLLFNSPSRVDSGIGGFDGEISLVSCGYYFLNRPWWLLICRNFALLFSDSSFQLPSCPPCFS